MNIQKHFSKERKQIFSDTDFRRTDITLRRPDGSVVFTQQDVEVPATWSQTACEILVQKYFRRRGVPNVCKTVAEAGVPVWLCASQPGEGATFGSETSARQVFHRLAGCWTYWGWKADYFKHEKSARIFYEELLCMLFGQIAAPNSPQWFNTGLHWAYGITGPAQGHFALDLKSKSLKRCTSAYERPQPHACFIQGVEDTLLEPGGIVQLWEKEARLFKYGSGTGTNFSTLRSKNEQLSGGGSSSGLMSFLNVSDAAAGAIKSGGTTRRAAKMVILDVDHPEIESFIQWKVNAEYNAASLISGSKLLRLCLHTLYDVHSQKDDDTHPEQILALQRARSAGIPETLILQTILRARDGTGPPPCPEHHGDWEGSAYAEVGGQHSNNSIRVTDAFMEARHTGALHELRARTTGDVMSRISATSLWQSIGLAAWTCADPGVQFHDTINRWHTCPNDGDIRASNPCAEYMFLDDTACNLASLNLIHFLDEEGTLAYDSLQHAARLWTIVLDISVTMAAFPSKILARQSLNYRTLGLGISNGGGLLMALALPYGSKQGRSLLAGITSLITATAYATSAELAQHLSPFPRFTNNAAAMHLVLKEHRAASRGKPPHRDSSPHPLPCLLRSAVPPTLIECLDKAWDQACRQGKKHGYRNAQTSCIAPTGTIGLLMDCDTTGIEPDYALVKFKKLAGGGYLRLVNSQVPIALKRLGYSDTEIQAAQQYISGTGTLRNAPGISLEMLRKKGITDAALERLETTLGSAVHLRLAALHCLQDEVNTVHEDPLQALGFTEHEITIASRHACGALTIEEAPHVKKEHYPVFACANPLLPGESSVLTPNDHVSMLAAVQPFVSGAISKTINLPETASHHDVVSIYDDAWKNGIKAISVYRDGAKISQPLMTRLPGNTSVPASLKELLFAGAYRRKLPERRNGYTQKASIGGQKIFLRTGEYDDGTPGEIFIDIHKEGATFRSLMNHFAIAISMGLQYGVPLEEFVEAFTHTRFEPNGIVQGHEHIRFASSITDYIFKDLAISYLERYDLRHDETEVAVTEVSSTPAERATGNACPLCGNFSLFRAGTCLYCRDCGHSTGCS